MGFLLDGLENGLTDELVAGLCPLITVGGSKTRGRTHKVLRASCRNMRTHGFVKFEKRRNTLASILVHIAGILSVVVSQASV
jgi:hypothetical protein